MWHFITRGKSIAADNDVVGLVGDWDGAETVHGSVDVVLVDPLLPRLDKSIIDQYSCHPCFLDFPKSSNFHVEDFASSSTPTTSSSA